MWVLGRLCWLCPQAVLLSWGSLPGEVQSEPGESNEPSGFGWVSGMSGGNVVPQHLGGGAGRRGNVAWDGDMAPRHDQPAHGQARLDVPHVPHPVSTNHIAERP